MTIAHIVLGEGRNFHFAQIVNGEVREISPKTIAQLPKAA
jgi:hypothetical protein